MFVSALTTALVLSLNFMYLILPASNVGRQLINSKILSWSIQLLAPLKSYELRYAESKNGGIKCISVKLVQPFIQSVISLQEFEITINTISHEDLLAIVRNSDNRKKISRVGFRLIESLFVEKEAEETSEEIVEEEQIKE